MVGILLERISTDEEVLKLISQRSKVKVNKNMVQDIYENKPHPITDYLNPVTEKAQTWQTDNYVMTIS